MVIKAVLHKGSTLIEQVINPDHLVMHTLSNCSSSGKLLEDSPIAKIIKRQVFALPPQTLEVTEHQACSKLCSCGHKTIARFPEHVTAPTQYGKRIKGIIVYLLNQQLIPEDRTQETLQDLWNCSIATMSAVTASAARFDGMFAQFIADIGRRYIKDADLSLITTAVMATATP